MKTEKRYMKEDPMIELKDKLKKAKCTMMRINSKGGKYLWMLLVLAVVFIIGIGFVVKRNIDAHRMELLTGYEREIVYREKNALDNIVLNQNVGSDGVAKSLIKNLMKRRPEISNIRFISRDEINNNKACSDWKAFTTECGHIDGSKILYPERYVKHGLNEYIIIDVSDKIRDGMMSSYIIGGIGFFGGILFLVCVGYCLWGIASVFKNLFRLEGKMEAYHSLKDDLRELASLRSSSWINQSVEEIFSENTIRKEGLENLEAQLKSIRYGFTKVEQFVTKDFEHVENDTVKTLSLKVMCRESYDEIGGLSIISLGSKTKCTFDDFFDDVRIRMKPSKFKMAVLSIYSNAVAACKNMDDVQIEIYTTVFRKEKIARVYIRDNGPGIPKEILNKVFERGFTTKKTGTGCGLCNAKEIMEEIGGRIELESKPGVGTSVALVFPVFFA